MTAARGRLAAFVATVLTAVALCLGTAMPDVAAASEAPSPSALGLLVRCHAPTHSGAAAIEGCPAVLRAASAGTMPTGRRLPVDVPTPAPSARAVATTTSVVIVRERSAGQRGGSANGARAPPLLQD